MLLNLVNTAFYERLVKVLHEDCYAPGAGGQWIDLNDSLYAFHIRFNSELGNEHNMFLNSMNELRILFRLIKFLKIVMNDFWSFSSINRSIDCTEGDSEINSSNFSLKRI